MLCTLVWLQHRYIVYLVYVSFCKCDIITQFAVHLYDCTLYERSLQLNCFHMLKWFLHRSKIWANKALHVTSLIWKKSVAQWQYWKLSSMEHRTLQVQWVHVKSWNLNWISGSELHSQPRETSVGEPTMQQLLAAYRLARKLELLILFFLPRCCCAPKGVTIPCQVG